MSRPSNEYRTFNKAMDTILKADPKAVKDAMEAEKQEREDQRKAKRSSADHASTGKD
jgi:hypothetical protein